MIGLVMFFWSVICLASVVVFPDKSSLPGLLLVMLFGSLILATVFKILVSDTCKSIKRRSSEHVQERFRSDREKAKATEAKYLHSRTARCCFFLVVT